MNQKGFANIVLIIVIVVIVAVGGYFVFVKKSEPVAQQTPTLAPSLASTPTPAKTTAPSPTPSPVVKSGWKTYGNSKYKFSIQYPCNTKCQFSPPAPYRNAYVADEIWLPTANEQTQVLLFTFSDESVKGWNDNLEGPGDPFPYSVQKMRNELSLQVGQSCQIYEYFNSNEVAHSVERCSVVSLNGEKALRLVVGSEGPNDTGTKIRYLVSRRSTLWIEVNEFYNTYNFDFLTDQSKVTPELQKQISAAAEVTNTLNFFK